MSKPSSYIGPNRPARWRELLVAMRDGQIAPPDTSGELGALLQEAERNELGPHVAHALLRAGDDRPEVSEVHERAQERIDLMLAAADDIASVLAGAGVPTLALKNVGIARAIYPCAACTPMGDIDLVVRRSDFRKSHELLVDHGLKLDTRAPEVEPADLEHGYESGGCEYRYGTGEGEVWIELQWRAVAGRWIQPHQEPDADGLVERSRTIDGSSLRLLDATDNMLQVALHTAKHSYCRAPGLRLHTDVHRLATHDPPDWRELVGRAHALGVATAVFFSLDIPRTLLGSPIPDWVLGELEPGARQKTLISRMLRRAGIFEPHERKFSRGQMIAFHSALYDSPRHFLASLSETPPDEVHLRNLPRLAKRGARRTRDLVSRYQH